jgi:DNA (cytosine-5)-methyltransferase 1
VITFGSLFAGIGGIDLGLERAGMTCKWQVEWDSFCQKILTKHWPDVPKYGDVHNVGKHNLETVDLIAGGFPCQPHSVAGKRKGAGDDRNLWPEYFRIIKELKPRYVLGENVPGIVTTYIDKVLSDLESEAYTCTTFNLPAVAFDAPHRRERIFVVAYSNGLRCQDTQKRQGSVPEFGSTNEQVEGWRRDNLSNSQGIHGLWSKEEEGNNIQESRRFCRGSWGTKPRVGRMAYGVADRVDRLRGLGNAVVPQVAQWIGERILEFDAKKELEARTTST